MVVVVVVLIISLLVKAGRDEGRDWSAAWRNFPLQSRGELRPGEGEHRDVGAVGPGRNTGGTWSGLERYQGGDLVLAFPSDVGEVCGYVWREERLSVQVRKGRRRYLSFFIAVGLWANISLVFTRDLLIITTRI